MTSAPAVGIIGVGTIGRALIAAFEGRTPLHLHDPALPDTRPMADLVARCQVVFLCVPTPMGSGEHADVTAVHDAVARFVTSGGAAQGAPILCVRSAVPPTTIATVQRAHPGLRLVMAPEFLRQRAAISWLHRPIAPRELL